MKSLGIIAEYNPFHQGHEYIIEKAMEATKSDVLVSVMSGNFVQRGQMAISDKWQRAREAVDRGVNIVVELPTVYACNSAEYFAAGAVEILEGFGCIDKIAFGSETGDIGELKKVADYLKENDYKIHQQISKLTRTGMSYPKARETAVSSLEKEFDTRLISAPNNILAVEYIKHLKTIEPYTVKRMGAGYHQSASVIRKEMMCKNPDFFKAEDDVFFKLICAKIMQSDVDKIEETLSADEGLAHKLKNEIRYASSLEQLIDRIKSKVYTRTRISRLLTQLLLGIDKETFDGRENYIRILAIDIAGAKFLKDVKNRGCATLPIITNINKEIGEFGKIKKTLDIDIRASDIYNLITGKGLYDYADYVKMPYIKSS